MRPKRGQKSFIEKRHSGFFSEDGGDDTVPTERFSCEDGDNDVTGHLAAIVFQLFLTQILLQLLRQVVSLLMLAQPLQRVAKKLPNSLEAGQLFVVLAPPECSGSPRHTDYRSSR